MRELRRKSWTALVAAAVVATLGLAAALVSKTERPRRFLTAEEGYVSIAVAVQTPPLHTPAEALPVVVWLPNWSGYDRVSEWPFDVLAHAMDVAFVGVMPPWRDEDDADPTWTTTAATDATRVFNAVWMVRNDARVEDDRLVLIGFARAGAAALRVALHTPDRVAGVIAVEPTLGPPTVRDTVYPNLEQLAVAILGLPNARGVPSPGDTADAWAGLFEAHGARVSHERLSGRIAHREARNLQRRLPELLDHVLTHHGRPSRAARASTHLEIRARKDLRDFVWSAVRFGLDTPEEIREAARARGTGRLAAQTSANTVERALNDALHEKRHRESAWTTPTDNDRLDRAFQLLEGRGIVARQDFKQDSEAAIAALESTLGRRLARFRGFTFFHRADVEHTDRGWLYLSYGALDRHAATGREVGREVVAALLQVGLRPKWNGSFERRVGIPITWQKRSFTGPPP